MADEGTASWHLFSSVTPFASPIVVFKKMFQQIVFWSTCAICRPFCLLTLYYMWRIGCRICEKLTLRKMSNIETILWARNAQMCSVVVVSIVMYSAGGCFIVASRIWCIQNAPVAYPSVKSVCPFDDNAMMVPLNDLRPFSFTIVIIQRPTLEDSEDPCVGVGPSSGFIPQLSFPYFIHIPGLFNHWWLLPSPSTAPLWLIVRIVRLVLRLINSWKAFLRWLEKGFEIRPIRSVNICVLNITLSVDCNYCDCSQHRVGQWRRRIQCGVRVSGCLYSDNGVKYPFRRHHPVTMTNLIFYSSHHPQEATLPSPCQHFPRKTQYK